MDNSTNSPMDEQQKYVNMMPDYGEHDDKSLRVGFGRRFGAAIIDAIIMTLLMCICFFIFGVVDLYMSFDWVSLATDPVGLNSAIEELMAKVTPITLIVGVIITSMEVFFAATPGKMALGIVIANADRTRANMKTLFIRFIVKQGQYVFMFLALLTSVSLLSSIGSLYTLIIIFGALAMLSENKQALHDMVPKTAVYFRDELKENANN